MEPEFKPLLTGVIVFVVIICVYALMANSVPMIIQEKSNSPIGEIFGSRSVSQSFISPENKLNRIDIKFATYNRINTNDVIFQLREANSSEYLVVRTVNGKKLTDNSFHSFIFDPIYDSKGKSYIFSIQSPRSKPGNSITIWYNTTDAYQNGSAIVNNTTIQGDLSFRAFYKVSVLDVLSFFLVKFTKDIPFAIFYIVLITTIVIIIIRLQLREMRGKK